MRSDTIHKSQKVFSGEQTTWLLLTSPVRPISRGNPEVPFKFRENQKGVIIGFDDIICLLEPYIVRLYIARRRKRSDSFPNGRFVIDGDGSVLVCPLEESVCFALVHVLFDVEDDDVVVDLHLECYPPCVVAPRPAEDELELDILAGPASVGVDRTGVTQVGGADEVSAFICCVDGEDADEEVNGGERVCEVMGERALFLTIRPPRPGSLVGGEDVVDEGSERVCKRDQEAKREEDSEWVGGDEGVLEEALPGLDSAREGKETGEPAAVPQRNRGIEQQAHIVFDVSVFAAWALPA